VNDDEVEDVRVDDAEQRVSSKLRYLEPGARLIDTRNTNLHALVLEEPRDVVDDGEDCQCANQTANTTSRQRTAQFTETRSATEGPTHCQISVN